MSSAFSYCATLSVAIGLSSTLLADGVSTQLRSAFATHCVHCHGNDGIVEGEVDLLALQSAADLQAQPALLEALITALTDRVMPPEDAPPLPAAKRKQMVADLQAMLASALKTLPFLPTPIRRMNRFQYNNAVVDLLELDRDIFQLNERLLRRRDDYFRPATKQMPDRVRVSSRPLSKDIDNERPEGFKDVAAFPQDQRAEHGFDNRADHLTLSPLLMESFLELSRTIVESPDLNPRECRSWDRLFAPPGKPARSPVAGRYEAEMASSLLITASPQGRAERQEMHNFGSQWGGNAQLFWRCPSPDQAMTLAFETLESGSGLRLALTKAPDYGTFAIYLDEQKIGDAVNLYAPQVARAEHNLQLPVEAGPHTLRFQSVAKDKRSQGHFFGLDYVEVTGRVSSPQSDQPVSEIDAIRNRLPKLLRRAFRRPVDPHTVDRFAKFAEQQLAAGTSFEDTMRTVVGVVLGMPDFLYIYDTPTEEVSGSEVSGRQRIDDIELASRLAQFFWSSIPDETLLDLAESGQLGDPVILSAQIDRMLNDRRSSRFCDNFPGQWLQLDRLITAIPDPQQFPYFYYQGYRTSMHMMTEPLLLFGKLREAIDSVGIDRPAKRPAKQFR